MASNTVDIDDTDSRFDYKDESWQLGFAIVAFNSTFHTTSTAGAQVVFGPFYASSIAVFTIMGASQPVVHFTVDGSSSADTSAQINSGSAFQQKSYSVNGLDPSQPHSLAINVLNDGPFTLDYVQIQSQQLQTAAKISSSSTSVPSSSTSAPSSSTSSTSTTSTPSPLTTNTSSTTITFTSISSSTAPTSIVPTSPTPLSAPSNALASTGTSPILSPTQAPSVPVPLTTTPLPAASQSTTSTVARSASGIDGTVIGSVVGSIVLVAILTIALAAYLLRRRRQLNENPDVSKNKLPSTFNPPAAKRPSLRLNISSMRQKIGSSILPTHSRTVSDLASVPASYVPQHRVTSPSAPTFLAMDPNESPIFDIKERPVSGLTMATKVTVGTTIGQRVSIPETPYSYRYPETPSPSVPVTDIKGNRNQITGIGSTEPIDTGPRPSYADMATNRTLISDDSESGRYDHTNERSLRGEASFSLISIDRISPSRRPLPQSPTNQGSPGSGNLMIGAQLVTNRYRTLPDLPVSPTSVLSDGSIIGDRTERFLSNSSTQLREDESPPPYQPSES